ncbi:MAG: hypothetical protein KJZ83_15120 [Burkholderiaceae bacterium]|nr:hypothetical protein [Burkholderiaceae bacterium]
MNQNNTTGGERSTLSFAGRRLLPTTTASRDGSGRHCVAGAHRGDSPHQAHSTRSRVAAIATYALLAAASATANADVIPIDSVGFLGWNVAGSHPSVTFTNPGNASAPAGEFRIVLTEGSSTRNDTAFCIEPNQTISFGTHYGNYTLLTGASTGLSTLTLERLSSLYEGFLDPVPSGPVAGRTNALGSAAFQIAVWEITFDGAGALDLTQGQFSISAGSASSAAGQLASSWLATMPAAPGQQTPSQSAGVAWEFSILRHASRQDQLLALREEVPVESRVPVPATGALLGIGAIALAGMRAFRAPGTRAAPAADRS